MRHVLWRCNMPSLVGLVFAANLVILPTFLAAQSAAKPVVPPPTAENSTNRPRAASDVASDKQLVSVKISTSRPDVTRNHAWGLTADIQNISPASVVIAAAEVTLVMQPEATQNTQCDAAYTSFLPNTTNTQGSDKEITLQPGEHYLFFWSGTDYSSTPDQACMLGRFGKLAETLNFYPGAYTFVVEGKLRTVNDPSTYHTFAESISVKMTIEQLAIMLFAGMGAILAYLVTALQPNADFDRARSPESHKISLRGVLSISRNVASAFLLGAVLAIVANRLSDTQFPVKVSVNDVWGALTVGFVFYFLGNKIIDKLKGLNPSSGPQQNTNPRPAPPHAGGSQT